MTDDARAVDWARAAAALPHGAAVIVRHRDARAREALARRLSGVCRARRIKLIIADDAGLALKLRADGVHVPQRHGAKIAALKARHGRWIVTTSAHGAASLDAARRSKADGVLIAPVFPTASHPERAHLGVTRFAALAQGARAYALGGIDSDSIARLSPLPLCGVALIGGWTG